MVNEEDGKKQVRDRWWSSEEHKRVFKKRELKGKPQYTVDALYISPFTLRRQFTSEGVRYYVPVERNLAPSGIEILDSYLNYLTRGNSSTGAFCKSYGISTSDIDSLCFLLTGLSGRKFKQLYQDKLLDELLRYTNLPLDKVAPLCGLGSASNLYLTCVRDFGMSPGERRYRNRSRKDIDLFRLGE